MSENLTVYIDRLRGGEDAIYEVEVPEEVLDASDGELRFPKGVALSGRAYLADDHLVLTLEVDVEAEMTCTVCNEWTPVGLSIKKYYVTKPLSEIPSNVYSFLEDLRDGILLEVPQFAECGGNCPNREALQGYCGKEEKKNLPFKDL